MLRLFCVNLQMLCFVLDFTCRVILCHKLCSRGMFYIVLFCVLVSHLKEVWMCAEASHTPNKVEFHVIYLS